ncbi:golvesin C-terminal-like domain-containing protein [Palleniella intestinalis]|jgi:Fibronectin type III domain.|uniref:golvesin C-terminal-like domain-containing protein n=1 Tax=Palleniella intestinalis TaxID=2736291 RepID=UPI001554F374|nr:fibronectin type III domain-containing protein [Palleniella intestinalis]
MTEMLRKITLTVLLINILLSVSAQQPWVRNVSKATTIENGLAGKHLSVWPSHGRYYNISRDRWEWQRAQLYGTCEDVFTQSIVYPYLIPMLENAGANIFVPRERDWQTNMVIVDNDMPQSGYSESAGKAGWVTSPLPGFATTGMCYKDGDRPFATGTARMARTTAGTGTDMARAFYFPKIRERGRYAVYVSYQTVEESIDDAEYIVCHRGTATTFRVNQQMGSSTWVYLGTFEFEANAPTNNYVCVTNRSAQKGVVTTDAVRFGGGMGDHQRGGKTSGLPRALEAARYYTQFAGVPKAMYMTKTGKNDYSEDINCRSLASNWLSYGSCTNPIESPTPQHPVFDIDSLTLAENAVRLYVDSITKANIDSFGTAYPDSLSEAVIDSTAMAVLDSVNGTPLQQINLQRGDTHLGHVPLDLQLAIHSDAGWLRDFTTHYGTLTICTTNFNNKETADGRPRSVSKNFATELLRSVSNDLNKAFGKWVVREVWDKNYSETRLPAQPSAILETMSHENFPDLKCGHDPNFKFVLSRAIYKTILRWLCERDGRQAVVQPLTPQNFSAATLEGDELTLKWSAQTDSLEPSAVPDSYVLYTGTDKTGYDNGHIIKGTEHKIRLSPNTLYRFRLTAANSGGESFPTEELVALYSPEAKETVMIVNAFHRLSSPAVVETDSICGFDLDADVGLSLGKTPAWIGHQQVFDKTQAGKGTGLGFTNNDLLGRFTAGNDFNYAFAHAEAVRNAGKYNVVSLSSNCFSQQTDITGVSVLDILFGNEKDDGYSLLTYKTFTPQMREGIEAFIERGGGLFLSGSYIASDMQEEEEQAWLADNLHIMYGGTDCDSLPFRKSEPMDIVSGNGMQMSVFRHVNDKHYASVASDILFSTDSLSDQKYLAYASGSQASVTYDGDAYRVFALGFPFECVKDAANRNLLMKKILAFLRRGKKE